MADISHVNRAEEVDQPDVERSGVDENIVRFDTIIIYT